ncbi:DUF4199 domain-containing protein [Spirosoma harenae]
MRKNVLTYGLIAGIIESGMFAVTIPLWQSEVITFDNSIWVGYTTMVIALSLIFFGIKSYRDNHLGGVISFGTAFKIGLFITLIASLLYCITWEICYNTIFSDFMVLYGRHMQKALQTSGASAVDIAKKMAEFQQSAEAYKNPVIRFDMTFMEIFPVGLIITLISAGLLRKREFLSAEAN